jgi:hypothetical protein
MINKAAPLIGFNGIRIVPSPLSPLSSEQNSSMEKLPVTSSILPITSWSFTKRNDPHKDVQYQSTTTKLISEKSLSSPSDNMLVWIVTVSFVM